MPQAKPSWGGGAHPLRTRRRDPGPERTPQPSAPTPSPPAQGRPFGTLRTRQQLTVGHRRIRLLPRRVHLQPQRLRIGQRERPRGAELLLGDEAELHAVVPASQDPDRSWSRGQGASASAPSRAARRSQNPAAGRGGAWKRRHLPLLCRGFALPPGRCPPGRLHPAPAHPPNSTRGPAAAGTRGPRLTGRVVNE